MIPNYNPYLMQNQQMQNLPQYGQNSPTQVQSPFVSVRSEAEARNYPVGYGNSVTFKDETAPYVYSKTMGFSQLDKPVFEKYRLIKEDSSEELSNRRNMRDLEAQIEEIWKEIDSLKERKKGRNDEYTGNGKSVQTKSNGNVVKEV
jgi:hypothetical protein